MGKDLKHMVWFTKREMSFILDCIDLYAAWRGALSASDGKTCRRRPGATGISALWSNQENRNPGNPTRKTCSHRRERQAIVTVGATSTCFIAAVTTIARFALNFANCGSSDFR
jgi:hypothetical protein